LGKDHPDLAISLNNLAEVYKEQGKFTEAEPLFKRALEMMENSLGPDHPHILPILENLSDLYMKTGRIEEAGILGERIRSIR
jgi:tetratricopeptide (TPR) repeat protein